MLHFLEFLYAAGLVYLCAIVFIKFTILAFYWRIFSLTVRLPMIIFGILITVWFVVLVRQRALYLCLLAD